MENEEELKKEVVELFNKLKEERTVTYDFTLGMSRDPDPRKFVEIFEKMYDKCAVLQSLHSDKYDLTRLSHTREKELSYVCRFEYKYDKCGEKTTKSKNELTSLMRDVIEQVKIDIPYIFYS